MDMHGPELWATSLATFVDLYDLAFGYRDFAAEADFLTAAASLWGNGPPRRVIEWAAGPSRHLAAFAARGAEVVAVDLSPAMLALAERRIGAPERTTLVAGDMREVVVAPAADLGFTMLSSIHGLSSEADLLAHLGAVAASLQQGGLYVIEATHPRDLTAAGAWSTAWHTHSGADEVYGRFALDLVHRRGQLLPARLELRGRLTGAMAERTLDMAWCVPDVDRWRELVAATPGLTLAAVLGDLDVTVSHDHPDAWRLVLVIRRL